jgi:Hsp20/alpha crystallin family protein
MRQRRHGGAVPSLPARKQMSLGSPASATRRWSSWQQPPGCCRSSADRLSISNPYCKRLLNQQHGFATPTKPRLRGRLAISGKKTINYKEGVSVHRRERVSGEFDRTLSIPVQVDPDGIKAEFRDGVLALLLPRAESDKPRSIKIA